MTTEFAERYRAIDSRDARFDGQFFTAVSTTRIYCRPSCPARTPKPENVTFYLTSAAAHEAGFRACKRCLPEATPGTPQWNLRGDLAARAMRLIGDGIVDREGVEGLATRLGYTPRHVQRLLVAELGAGPQSLARARRAQTARSLLVGTDLRLADVAFASGFGSVRQFNDTVREVFDVAPGELRARRSPTRAPATTDHVRIALSLPVRHPFDAPGTFRFLLARAVDGVEVGDVAEDRLRYARTLELPHGPGAVEVVATARRGRWELQAELELSSLSDVGTAVARLRRLLDLDADPVAIDTALSADPALVGRVADTPGIRVPGTVDPHELLVRAMVGQQISVAAARTHLARAARALGTPYVSRFPGLDRLFPSARQFAEGVESPDRPLRLPARSIATIGAAARDLAAGDLVVDVGTDPESLRESLVARPGIGPWTAAYVAMRVLGDPDSWLPTDVALVAGARALGLVAPEVPTRSAHRELAERAADWAPWRSYAVLHLWNSTGGNTP
jgi:AraC family transcriptional regulator, regulatory protein of adaptative response / DNA-3-methyladenine glycosylase II